MARKYWKLICVQSSQKIRDSEDGLDSVVCQKGSYWAFNENSFSGTWGISQIRMMPTMKNWGKGSSGKDSKDCIRSPGSQQNHCYLGIFSSQLGSDPEQPDLSVKLALHSTGYAGDVQRSLLACITEQVVILTDWPWWGAAVGATSTVFC